MRRAPLPRKGASFASTRDRWPLEPVGWTLHGRQSPRVVFAASPATAPRVPSRTKNIELFAEAKRSPPGAKGLIFLPYLAGERAPLWDADRRGAFIGLSLSHDRGDMARAVCESIAYGLRLPVEIARQGGVRLDLVRTSGASARNLFLDSLKADILGIPVETTAIPDCELVGDACASALALGEASTVSEACPRPRPR